MVPHIFPVAGDKALGSHVDVSLDRLGDVGDLSVCVEGDQGTGLGGEHLHVDGLGAELEAGSDLMTCLRNLVNDGMRRPYAAIEEPTMSLNTHVRFKFMVGDLL